MSRISVQWTVSLPPELSKRAILMARHEIRSRSELVREALREYIAKQARFIELRKKLAASMGRRGIKSTEDIERMIDEGRA